jgi:serine/threonine-protein kinase TTK/MPS1
MSRSTLRNRPSSRQDSHERPADEASEIRHSDINTPNQAGRVVRIVTGSTDRRNRAVSSGPSSGRSNLDRSAVDKSAAETEYDQSEVPETVARNPPPIGTGSTSRYPSTVTRHRLDENGNLQSSMRMKRVGKLPGSFLSGPARRGRQRQSEEVEEGHAEGEAPAIPGQEPEGQPAEEQQAASSFYRESLREDFNSGSPISASAATRVSHRRQPSNAEFKIHSARSSPGERPTAAPEEPKPVDIMDGEFPMPNIRIPSGLDQENQAPLGFKRNKPAADHGLEKPHNRGLSVDQPVAKTASPERKPLAIRDQNTPHRPAPPPPPKMSVLEAATSKTGAATTTQAKQRRNILKVNGKCYTRLDCLGRGGSAKVYRVTAENGNMFAIKRVALENADENQIKGYRGEIDLLSKLTGVDRVINLFDYEMNDEKRVLTLVSDP